MVVVPDFEDNADAEEDVTRFGAEELPVRAVISDDVDECATTVMPEGKPIELVGLASSSAPIVYSRWSNQKVKPVIVSTTALSVCWPSGKDEESKHKKLYSAV